MPSVLPRINFSITDYHVRQGLLLLEEEEPRKAFMEALKRDATEFREEYAILLYRNAKLVGEPYTPDFDRQGESFMYAFLLLIGTLYAANNKSFPSITRELMDGVTEEWGLLLNDPDPWSERLKSRLTDLNDTMVKMFETTFKGKVDEIGIIFIYTLAEMFLRGVNQSDSLLVAEVETFFDYAKEQPDHYDQEDPSNHKSPLWQFWKR